jgi:Nif-specific regulatory protein
MATDPQEWRRLMEAGATFTAYMDLDEVLRQVLPYASESAHAQGSRVILHDTEARELVVVASGGAVGTTRGQRFPEDQGVAGAVLASGRGRIVADPAAAHAEVDGRPMSASGKIIVSMMAAPLKIGARTLGVVQAVNRVGGGSFDASDLERFEAACSLIAVAVQNASLYRRLDKDIQLLRRAQEDQIRPLIAESPAMRRALIQAERAAAGKSTVLLVGETGTGKEQVARRIHEASPRARSPFVALNCGALPEGLLESELFGHEKGAFTGADRRRIGRFELADGGTLFLDEVGELPPAAQVKLLRVLQEHEISRVGGGETIRVDVRLIAATHRDLKAEVRHGRFRDDLFFRIHVVPIHLPPLRDRGEDVEPLCHLFLQRLSRELGRAPRSIAPAALDRLRAHRWPGNVRELENLIERLLVLGDDEPISEVELAELLAPHSMLTPSAGIRIDGSDRRIAEALRPPVGSTPASTSGSAATEPSRSPSPAGPPPEPPSLWDQERQLLEQALARADNNQSRAARSLKISREQLRTRMKRYGLLPQKSSDKQPESR